MTTQYVVGEEMNIKRLTFAVLLSSCALMTACLDENLDPNDCDPSLDENCLCTLTEDGSEADDCIDGLTEDSQDCACEIIDSVDPVDPTPEADPQEPDPEPESFRFVMVEDLTANPSGDFPGADVDAISIIKASGDELFAANLHPSSEIDCEGNSACDLNALIGAPDAIDPETGDCFGLAQPRGADVDPTLFTALNGGFVIVDFSSVVNGDVTIENGDQIHVFEIGSTECNAFDDDPFSVSVAIAVSDDVSGSFQEIGVGDGSNIAPVTGL
jgi:hypothetical protein